MYNFFVSWQVVCIVTFMPPFYCLSLLLACGSHLGGGCCITCLVHPIRPFIHPIPTINSKAEHHTLFKIRGELTHIRSNWQSSLRSKGQGHWCQKNGWQHIPLAIGATLYSLEYVQWSSILIVFTIQGLFSYNASITSCICTFCSDKNSANLIWFFYTCYHKKLSELLLERQLCTVYLALSNIVADIFTFFFCRISLSEGNKTYNFLWHARCHWRFTSSGKWGVPGVQTPAQGNCDINCFACILFNE